MKQYQADCLSFTGMCQIFVTRIDKTNRCKLFRKYREIQIYTFRGYFILCDIIVRDK